MPVLNLYVSEDTMRRLERAATELGRSVEDLAEAALENGVLRDTLNETGARHDP